MIRTTIMLDDKVSELKLGIFKLKKFKEQVGVFLFLPAVIEYWRRD
jgi:hypothetical protein